MRQQLAIDLLKNWTVPALYTEELTALTRLTAKHIHILQKREHLILANTPKEGRASGRRVMYPFADAVEVLALAELIRLGVPPVKSGGVKSGESVLTNIANCVNRQIQFIAYPERTVTRAKKDGSTVTLSIGAEPYAILFYSEDANQGTDVFFGEQADSLPEGYTILDSTRVVVDCKAMASKLLSAFEIYQGNLAH